MPPKNAGRMELGVVRRGLKTEHRNNNQLGGFKRNPFGPGIQRPVMAAVRNAQPEPATVWAAVLTALAGLIGRAEGNVITRFITTGKVTVPIGLAIARAALSYESVYARVGAGFMAMSGLRGELCTVVAEDSIRDHVMPLSNVCDILRWAGNLAHSAFPVHPSGSMWQAAVDKEVDRLGLRLILAAMASATTTGKEAGWLYSCAVGVALVGGFPANLLQPAMFQVAFGQQDLDVAIFGAKDGPGFAKTAVAFITALGDVGCGIMTVTLTERALTVMARLGRAQMCIQVGVRPYAVPAACLLGYDLCPCQVMLTADGQAHVTMRALMSHTRQASYISPSRVENLAVSARRVAKYEGRMGHTIRCPPAVREVVKGLGNIMVPVQAGAAGDSGSGRVLFVRVDGRAVQDLGGMVSLLADAWNSVTAKQWREGCLPAGTMERVEVAASAYNQDGWSGSIMCQGGRRVELGPAGMGGRMAPAGHRARAGGL